MSNRFGLIFEDQGGFRNEILKYSSRGGEAGRVTYSINILKFREAESPIHPGVESMDSTWHNLRE